MVMGRWVNLRIAISFLGFPKEWITSGCRRTLPDLASIVSSCIWPQAAYGN